GAQEGDAPAPSADAPAATESAPPVESGGDSDTSDPTAFTPPTGGGEVIGIGGIKPKKDPFPLHVSASLSHFLGQGTFIQGHADNPYVASSLSLAPYAELFGLRFGIAQSFDFEYTQSDSTTYANQLMWSDTGLSVA